MEIYTLTIRLPLHARKGWSKKIEISDGTSLHDLHLYIQEIIGFDDDHLYEFFAGTSYSNRKIKYSEISGNLDGANYQNILLKEVFPIDGLKLYYIFDFGDYWTFEIKNVCNKSKFQSNITYPRVIDSIGKNPKQYHG